jgi:hypothetical protein
LKQDAKSKGGIEMKNQNAKNETHSPLPEKKFRAGAISATVWKNTTRSKDGKSVEYKTISIQRSYTDKSGAWQSTSSMRLNDLPKAALVINKAYEYLALKEQSGSGSDSDYSYSAEQDLAEAI